MSLARILEAAEGNAVATLKHLISVSGGTILEAHGSIMAASPDVYCGTYHNAVTRVDQAADPSKVIEAAINFFGSLDRRFILWITDGRDDDLEAIAVDNGLTPRAPGPGSAGMVRNRPVVLPRVPKGVHLTAVSDADDVAVFAQIVGQAYSVRDGVPERGQNGFLPAALTMFSEPSSLLSPYTHGIIAHLDGVPVSCAMALHSDAVAGLYWVSTVDATRRCGFAALIAATITNKCFERGAKAVVLQSSEMGAAIYEKMGFARFSWHRRYVGRAPSSVVASLETETSWRALDRYTGQLNRVSSAADLRNPREM